MSPYREGIIPVHCFICYDSMDGRDSESLCVRIYSREMKTYIEGYQRICPQCHDVLEHMITGLPLMNQPEKMIAWINKMGRAGNTSTIDNRS